MKLIRKMDTGSEGQDISKLKSVQLESVRLTEVDWWRNEYEIIVTF